VIQGRHKKALKEAGGFATTNFKPSALYEKITGISSLKIICV